MTILGLIILAAAALTLLYRGQAYRAWVIPGALGMFFWLWGGVASPFFFAFTGLTFLALAVVFGVPAVRQTLVTGHAMRKMASILPKISDTERLALEAGTIWFDGDLFSGRPDWDKLSRFRPKELTVEERAFVNGPANELCAMIDDYQATRDGDLSPEVWSFIKTNGFLGMIIPKEYGGLGFSAIGHSAVITKVSSRSVAAAVTVMVPNSLGPGELLLHYGTDEQKDYYLPRLAKGEEIPCFALTEPEAGSDAASAQSTGVVCKGIFNGEEVVGMRLNWNKRYATLAPVATVLGLAFKLEDPEGLLGGETDLGITCALIPTDLPGVDTGYRHDPLGVPFMNGPTTGENVFVPVSFIIGGPAMAGQGWRMLMESLAAGRSISLPALAVGAAQLSARYSGAYATVREQFTLPIGRFEGVQERLARIGGFTYLMEATRTLTAGAVDAGEKPSVISAMAKAYMTELMRVVLNDSMDVAAGAGISRGPRNVLALGYTSLPIGITVEGANILTRCLIVFGQGAIRCHPYVLDEIHAVADEDLQRFDHALFKHIGFSFSNAVRAGVLGLTGGRLARPPLGGELQPYFGHLTRMSAAFTFLADVSMGTLGGDLKRREMISGRMADALAWMYLGSATLKRFMDDGHPRQDLVFARWAMDYSLHQTQQALVGVLDNFPVPGVRFLKPLLFPLGARFKAPDDKLSRRVARELIDGAKGRERIASDVYLPPADEPGLGHLEATLTQVLAARPIRKKLREAIKAGRVKKQPLRKLVAAGLEAGVISEDEARVVLEAADARREAIQVDSFPPEAFGYLQQDRHTAGMGA